MNDVAVDGALLCLRDLWTQWEVASLEGVNADSIAMVFMLRPFPGTDLKGPTSQAGSCNPQLQRLLAGVLAYKITCRTVLVWRSPSSCAAELLILGTGAQIGIPSPAVQQALREQGIGLEVADTVRATAPMSPTPHTDLSLTLLGVPVWQCLAAQDAVRCRRPTRWRRSIS